jgi:hypothetical protein
LRLVRQPDQIDDGRQIKKRTKNDSEKGESLFHIEEERLRVFKSSTL